MASLNGADTAEKKLTIAMEFGLGVAASCLSCLLLSRFVLEILDHFFGPFFFRVRPREVSQNPFDGLLFFDCFKDF